MLRRASTEEEARKIFAQAEAALDTEKDTPAAQPQEVQQVGVTEAVGRDRRAARRLGVRDLLSLEALSTDELTEPLRTQPPRDGLLDVEGARFIGSHRQEHREVSPTQLWGQRPHNLPRILRPLLVEHLHVDQPPDFPVSIVSTTLVCLATSARTCSINAEMRSMRGPSAGTASSMLRSRSLAGVDSLMAQVSQQAPTSAEMRAPSDANM